MSYVPGYDKDTKIWKDIRYQECFLAYLYPHLFNVCANPDISSQDLICFCTRMLCRIYFYNMNGLKF